MKKWLLLIVALCFMADAYPQANWQWGQMGGSTYSTDAGNSPVSESILKMVSDQNGNTYALARIANVTYVGNDTSMPSARMYIVVSWACGGRVRWIKTIGSAFVRGIAADTLGGVYITGFMPVGSGNYFDRDTVIPPQGNNVLNGNFLVKYDTSGQLKWLRMPDPTIVTASTYANKPRFLHIQAAPDGTVFLLSYLPAGTHINGAYPVTRDGFHILKYDRNGTFSGGIPLPLYVSYDNGAPADYAIDQAKFVRDPGNGRFYLGGNILPSTPWPSFYIGSDTIRPALGVFVTSFDHGGNLKWIRKSDTASHTFFGDITVDSKGRLYFTGQVSPGASWNGSTFTGPAGNLIAFAASMDSNGINRWISGGTDASTIFAQTISVNRDDVVRVAGNMGRTFTWGTYHLSIPAPNPGGTGMFYLPAAAFMANLDPATGQCIGLDSIRVKLSTTISPTTMTCDRNGNFFIGGIINNPLETADSIATLGSSQLRSIGGTTDFFVAKYGRASCNRPVGTEVPTTSGAGEIRIFPNPVADELQVRGVAEGARYLVYSFAGAVVAQGTIAGTSSSISFKGHVPGLYVVVLRDDKGSRSFKVLKN